MNENPPSWKFIALFALFCLAVSFLIFGVAGAQDRPSTPVFTCLGLSYADLDTEYYIVYPNIDSSTITRLVGRAWFNDLMAIEGNQNAWVDTAEYGYFIWPDDTNIHVQIWLNLKDDSVDTPVILLYYSEQTPDVFYALSFHDLRATTDANGEHLGQHPCAAWQVEIEAFNDVFPDLVQAMRDSSEEG